MIHGFLRGFLIECRSVGVLCFEVLRHHSMLIVRNARVHSLVAHRRWV